MPFCWTVVLLATAARVLYVQEEPPVRACIDRASKAVQRRDLNAAIREYNAALALKPRNLWVVYYGRGDVYGRLGTYEKAIADFGETIRLKPDFTKAYIGRGNAYSRLDQNEKALADLNEAVRLDPKNAQAYCSRADVEDYLNKEDAALRDYNTALRLKPRYPMALNNRGGVYHKLRDIDKEVAGYKQSLQLEPKNVEAMFNLGLCYSQMKNYHAAVAQFDHVLQIREYLPAYSARAQIRYKLNDYSGARSDANKVSQLPPREAADFQSRGNSARLLESYGAALRNYREAVRRMPQSSAFHNSLGWLLATCSDAEIRNGNEAVQEATKSCDLTGWKHPGTLDTLAAAYAEIGKFDKAVNYEQQAVDHASPAAFDRKDLFEERLHLYEQKKPYRSPPVDP